MKKWTIRGEMAAVAAVGIGLGWVVFLATPRPSSGSDAALAAALAVAVGLPASVLLLGAIAFKTGPWRARLMRAGVALHTGLMVVVCAGPILAQAGLALARPRAVFVAHRRPWMVEAAALSLAMATAYAVAGWWLIRRGRGGERGGQARPSPTRVRGGPSQRRSPGRGRRERTSSTEGPDVPGVRRKNPRQMTTWSR